MMLHMRRILPLFVVLLTACTAATVDPQVPPVDTAASSQPTEQSAAAEDVTLEWVFTPDAESTEEMPMTRASLVLSGPVNTRIEVGSYSGNGAKAADTSWSAPEGSLATAIFWWAGGGDELSIFQTESDRLVIRHRTIDEVSGYGEFEDKMTLGIPENARVIVK
jgi:hypothetical protein